ncbi:hypothetical protein QBC35DRAFT_524746 [Podospora australis]|uniref:poly(ADP-ribose) glycohydrolase n=1 Tax=Podospora australis TaxID=1536484 RepID=A0AAN6WPA3_9PEZI|nr:hypothetical protein QBC35DRAFT_524746 [Podospora australis]
MAYPEFYTLPSSPKYKCDDRFSLHPEGDEVEDGNGQVPFWPFLQKIFILPAITSLGAELFFEKIWPLLVTVALEMPKLHPNGQLPVLGQGQNQSLRFSRRQTACLVVHQFLRTLSNPSWRENDGTHDFGIWYSSEQRNCDKGWNPNAVRAYLQALLSYFKEGACKDSWGMDTSRGGWAVEYTLHSLQTAYYIKLASEDHPLTQLKVEDSSRYDTSFRSLGLPSCQPVVISANKIIGFGQSGTQEDVHVGISPEACPIVLVTPPLGEAEVLRVRGAEAMVNVVGKGRDIVLDLVERAGLPDLIHENMEREINKAYTAFDGYFEVTEIRTGLWGCGAFGGGPEIKVLLLWLAASFAQVGLIVVCDRKLWGFARRLEDIVALVRKRNLGTLELRRILENAPKDLTRGQCWDRLRKEVDKS